MGNMEYHQQWRTKHTLHKHIWTSIDNKQGSSVEADIRHQK